MTKYRDSDVDPLLIGLFKNFVKEFFVFSKASVQFPRDRVLSLYKIRGFLHLLS